MKGTKPRKVYEVQEINHFRELLEMIEEKYANNIAYQYKKDIQAKEPEYVEVTYKKYCQDVKALSTGLLEMGLENKRIAIIGNNRYEWCTTYLAVTTGNMVIVPLDRALPDNEIESLIRRSEAEAVVFDKKFSDVMIKLKNDTTTNLKFLINMDNEPDPKNEIIAYQEVLEKGKKLLENKDTKYEKIKIDKNKMAVMLFTSGTTAESKAVMLSQYNICSDVVSVASFVKLYETDKLLSFLPMHHTFECTITFLYGMHGGTTIVFCDGLKYIQKNLKEYQISIFVAVPVILETMYKKIQKGIEEQGKSKLIRNRIQNFKCIIEMQNRFKKETI